MYAVSAARFYKTVLDSTACSLPAGVVVLWLRGFGGKDRSGFRLLVCRQVDGLLGVNLVPYFLVRMPPPELPQFVSCLIRLSATKVYLSNSSQWVEQAPIIAKRIITFARLIAEGKGKAIASLSVESNDAELSVVDQFGVRCSAQVFLPLSEESIRLLVEFRKRCSEEVAELIKAHQTLEQQLVEAERRLTALLVPVTALRSEINRMRHNVQDLTSQIEKKNNELRDSRPIFSILPLM